MLGCRIDPNGSTSKGSRAPRPERSGGSTMIRTVLAVLLAAPAAFATTYQIDPAHSSANFSVRHMMVSKVNGHFKSVKGTVEYDEKVPAATRIEAEIDATSLDTNEAKRDAHL